jgi:hypothetical protein
MIDKDIIVRFLGHLRHAEHKTLVKQAMHPHREWAIGLVLFFVVLISGGLYGVYMFTVYRDVHLSVTGVVDSVETYKTNTVAQALKRYTAKQEQFDRIGSTIGSSPVVTGENPTEAINDTDGVEDSTATSTPQPLPEEPVVETVPDDQALPAGVILE